MQKVKLRSAAEITSSDGASNGRVVTAMQQVNLTTTMTCPATLMFLSQANCFDAFLLHIFVL